MIKSIFPYLVLLLLCFSCSNVKVKNPIIDYSHYKEVLSDSKYELERIGHYDFLTDYEKDIEGFKAYQIFTNNNYFNGAFFTDTINNFIIEHKEIGYHRTSGLIRGIDAWVITDMTNGNRGHFVNLINQHVRTYHLYGKEVKNKQPQLDTIVIPDYERRLNRLIADLQIKDLESLQLVLSKVLGYRIQNKEELREEATLYDISRLKGSKNYDAEEMEICEKILKKSSADRCIYLDGFCDLYETQQRGLYQVFYNPEESGFDIQIDLIYFECNFIRSYEPYSEKINLDKERLGDTIKWIRPPQLRDRIK